MRSLALTVVFTCSLGACRGTALPNPGSSDGRAADEFFERGVLIAASDTGDEITFDALLARLAEAEAVFLGETHQDETTHRFERDVYAALIERTNGKVVLALEMFAREAQPILDRYLAGEIDEDAFLAEASPWRNYRTGYRPLIELAREHGLPVVASNVPADLRRRVSAGGAEAFAALTVEERAWIAPELLPNSEAYWERFARVVRGHMDVSEGPESLLFSGQSQWDNTMGYSCAEALDAHPDHVVLHVNGGFHSAYHDGTVAQLLLRRPGTDVLTVAIQPVPDMREWGTSLPGDLADFLVVADGRARGPDGTFHAVRSQRELRYALHVPANATDDEPVPFVIFLGDDGLRAEDSLAYWKLALGDEAALAVIEPPYPVRGDDLTLGGRWFWNETYHEDLATLATSLDEVQRYVLENYPVEDGLEELATVLAGEGTGATVVARAAFHGSRTKAIASRPSGFHKLREWPLPDRTGPRLEVVVASEEGRAWWEEELAAYAAIGLATALEAGGRATLRELEQRVRAAAGLPDLGTQAVPIAQGGETNTPKSRLWREVVARAQERGMDVPTVAELPTLLANGEASGDAIPPAPGLFGGTTVLVVPAGTPPEETAAWRALEGTDVMAPHGRVFGLRVALEVGQPGVAEVLEELKASGRSTALVVPASFCVDAGSLRTLVEQASGYRETMEISFLPGLGGRLPQAR